MPTFNTGFASPFLETRPEADIVLGAGLSVKGVNNTVLNFADAYGLSPTISAIKFSFVGIGTDDLTIKVFVNAVEITDATRSRTGAGSLLSGEVEVTENDTVQVEFTDDGGAGQTVGQVRGFISV